MKRLIFFIIALVMALGFSFLPAMASSEGPVAISVSPISVDFGSILPGRSVTGSDLTITNTGGVTVTVSTEITGDTSFYGSYLKLDGRPAGSWTDTINTGNSITVPTKLEGVPSNLNPGSYRCTVIFWAEEEAQ